MFNSQYYTCEQIDQRLLQGYLDDYNTQNNTNLNKAEFLTLLNEMLGKSGTVDNLIAQLGYFECNTAAGTAAKTVSASNYSLIIGGSLKVKFINTNTASSNVTLNINSKGAKPLYYNGSPVNNGNTWEAGEVVYLYYDGTNYYANSVLGGSDGVYDISVTHLTEGNPTQYSSLPEALGSNGTNIPTAKRRGGMTIKYIDSTTGKYVQYRYTSTSITNSNVSNVDNWEKFGDTDAIPTPGSVKPVQSGGVYAKLKGVTASEEKVTQQPITGSYIKGSDGSIVSSNNTAYLEIALGDVKSVRFLGGWYTSSSYTSGYAFGHYTDPSDPTTWVTDKSSVFDNNASTLGTKEYVIAVPEGATHFRTTTATSTVPALAQNFYCYLQSGESVLEMADKIADEKVKVLQNAIYGTQDREIGDNILSSFSVGKGAFAYTTPIVVDGVEYSYTPKNISGMQSVYLDVSSYKDGNHKIYIKGNSSRNTQYTWMKVATRPSGYKTFDELQEETLSDIHTQYASFSLDYDKEVELEIPDDAVMLFFTRNIYGVDSTKTNRLPQEVRIVTYTKTSDGDLDKTNKKLDEELKKFSDYVSYNLTFNQLNFYAQDSYPYYIQTNGVVNTNATYKHILVPTKEGEYVKVVRNKTYYAYIAFLTDTLTSGSAAPFVEGTGLYIISDKEKEHIYEVPAGAKYLYIFKWQNSGKVYYPKYIAISNSTGLPDIVVQNDYYETKRIIEQIISITRSEGSITDPSFKPLLLLHYSDIHGQTVNQDRINDFRGVFGGYLDDTIQTGDLLLTRFNDNVPFGDISTPEAIAQNPSRNILSVIGNHDTNGTDAQDNWHQNQGLPVYNKLIAPFVQYWNVTQPSGAAENGYCFYYKDYLESRVRLIVLDTFCIDSAYNSVQLSWFETTLNSAKENGLSVIVASHFRIKSNELIKSSFTALNAAVENPDTSGANDPYIPYIDAFIQSGGDFICWLTGHSHYDAISKRNEPLQINVCVGNASRYYNTNYKLYITNSMISSSPNDYKTFDLFNLIAVDTHYKLLTLVRIGSNYDKYGRYKKTTCIKYDTGELIF